MPSLNIKLVSITRSVKKSVQKVAKKLSFKKKNKKAIFNAQDKTLSVIEVVAPPAVAVLPVEEKKEVEKVQGRLLNDSANSIFMDLLDDSDDDDEEEEEDEEEERIFSRYFDAEKMFGTLQVLGSIIASSQRAERESRPTRVQHIKMYPDGEEVRPRARPVFVRQPSPLQHISFLPPSPPKSPTPPSLSPSSSNGSIKSSLAPSTPRGGSPTKNSQVAENRKRFAFYNKSTTEIRSDGYFQTCSY